MCTHEYITDPEELLALHQRERGDNALYKEFLYLVQLPVILALRLCLVFLSLKEVLICSAESDEVNFLVVRRPRRRVCVELGCERHALSSWSDPLLSLLSSSDWWVFSIVIDKVNCIRIVEKTTKRVIIVPSVKVKNISKKRRWCF